MSCELPADSDGLPGDARSWSEHEARERWSLFRRSQHALGRDELLGCYRFLVDSVLSCMLGAARSDPDLLAVEQHAVRGLEDAFERFPESGDPMRFEQFARARIRLAVEDVLQRLDWMPRTLRRNHLFPASRPQGHSPRSDEPVLDEALAASSRLAGTRPLRQARAADAAELHDSQQAPYAALARMVGLERDLTAGVERRPVETVRRALRRLPEQHRTVLTLQFLAGLSIEQVGALLGCSSIAARRASDHALVSLRQVIEEGCGPLAAAAG